jgi:RHS repeat-associated protein
VQVSNLSGAVTVAAGVDHSIAATGGAAVWDWGNNQYGQLGNGSTSESDVPVQPTGLGSVDTQTTATYTYDGTGLRATKTVNDTTSHFAYDLSSGTPLILTDGTTDYVYGPGGLPIEQVTGSGSPIYLSQDQLGSTRLLTNSSGAVVGTYSYDPAGNITSETGTATTNLLFAGQYLDQESGLYWMRARYYDPTTSQFISVDPLNTGVASPYSYVVGNPVNFTDPSGALTPTAAQLCSYGNTAACQEASAAPQYAPVNLCIRDPFAGSANSNTYQGCRTAITPTEGAIGLGVASSLLGGEGLLVEASVLSAGSTLGLGSAGLGYLSGAVGLVASSLDAKDCITTHNIGACSGAGLGLLGAGGGLVGEQFRLSVAAKWGLLGTGLAANVNDAAALVVSFGYARIGCGA